jgi:H+-transporting ATPase
LLYVVRERRYLWDSIPGAWVLGASTVDVTLVFVLALSGVLMEPLPWGLLVAGAAATGAFALVLDQIKLRVMSVLGT